MLIANGPGHSPTPLVHHLAEANIALARAPLGDSLMKEFVEQLDAVNAEADHSPGFIWRLQADQGQPSSYLQVYEDERIVFNLSVWDSIESLKSYVYRHQHAAVFRDRSRWFERLRVPSVALWWIPAGSLPTIDDGKARLARLAAHGPTVDAFTFQEQFDPPSPERQCFSAAVESAQESRTTPELEPND